VCNLLLEDGTQYECLLSPFHPWYCAVSISMFSFCLTLIDESGVLRSPTITVSGPICSFKLRSVYFMNLGTLMFSADIYLELFYLLALLFPLLVCSDLLYLF
jgi:hypothetical protein